MVFAKHVVEGRTSQRNHLTGCHALWWKLIRYHFYWLRTHQHFKYSKLYAY